MSGKKKGVYISKKRLLKVLDYRGETISSLGKFLNEKKLLTHRSLQRCLEYESIDKEVLENISSYLNVSLEYLTKENDRILEKELKEMLKENKYIDTIEQARELFYRFHDVAFIDQQGIIVFSYNEYSNEKDYKEPLKAYETFLISLSRNNQVHNFKTGETIIFNNSQEIKETIGESVYMDLYEYIVQEINKTIFKNTKKKGNNKR